MSCLKVDSANIYFEQYGSGPAILLTHGFSATSSMWHPQIEALSKSNALILWDLPGHGQSGLPENSQDCNEVFALNVMVAILDSLSVEVATIGGLSLGGYLSLAFHAMHPERTSALLIIDTGPGFKNPQARENWNVTARKTADKWEKESRQELLEVSPEQRVANHKDRMGVATAARYLLTQHSSHVIESLPAIKVPAIVVAGDNDKPFIPATEYMAKKIPGSKKAIIPNAGHASNMDQPVLFNKEIVEFLANNNL